jgi:lipoprotein-releasing system permease protein
VLFEGIIFKGVGKDYKWEYIKSTWFKEEYQHNPKLNEEVVISQF